MKTSLSIYYTLILLFKLVLFIYLLVASNISSDSDLLMLYLIFWIKDLNWKEKFVDNF